MPRRVEVVVRGQVPLTGIVQLLLESNAERKAVFTRIDVREREREENPGFRGLIAYGVYAEIRFEWHNTKITRRT